MNGILFLSKFNRKVICIVQTADLKFPAFNTAPHVLSAVKSSCKKVYDMRLKEFDFMTGYNNSFYYSESYSTRKSEGLL